MSIGVIGIVTSIVLMRYSTFDSTVLLKNEAYEVALAVREAQVKSVGAVRAGDESNYAYAYGVSFEAGSNTYETFLFRSAVTHPSNVESGCTYDGQTNCSESLQGFAFDKRIEVVEICIEDDCSVDRLDVAFRRPEFAALYTADGDHVTPASAYVKLASDVGLVTFIVEITSLGQISVYPEEN